MIDDLLPIPFYINSKLACKAEFEKGEKRVSMLSPSKEKKELEKRLAKIGEQLENEEEGKKQLISKHIKKRDGKYIVFCSNKDKLDEYYKQADKWFENIGPIKKYKVHSYQKKEKNQQQLDSFNDSKEGLSVLFCVDILNEGVHVDDIDGVFLLRKTISPIIYFQQIGRALSFSGRNKQIKIFDFVNNFGNHNAIDEVFEEFESEIKKKILEHPEKKQEYEEKLRRFKILDETKAIIKKISEIKQKTSYDNIIKSRVEYAIQGIDRILKNRENKQNLYLDSEFLSLYASLNTYAEYVTNEQFTKLQSFGIILPEELSMTLEEREQILEGYDSLHEKYKHMNKAYVKSLLDFIEKEERKPDSNIDEEKILINRYLSILPNLNEEDIEQIKKAFKDKNIKFETYEKILFNIPINNFELQQIIDIANKLLENGNMLPKYIKNSIIKFLSENTTTKDMELISIIEKDEEHRIKEAKTKQAQRYEKLTKIKDYIESNIEISVSELQKVVISNFDNLTDKDFSFIKRTINSQKTNFYKEHIYFEEDKKITDLCNEAKKLSIEQIEEYIDQVMDDKQIIKTLNELIDFMVKHSGKSPNLNAEDLEEKKLAKKISDYISNGVLSEKFLNIEEDISSRGYDPRYLMFNLLNINKDKQIKLVLLQSLKFLYINGRRPLVNSDDNEERILAENYEKMCVDELGQKNLGKINRIFNQNKYLRKTTQQYIINQQRLKKEIENESKRL